MRPTGLARTVSNLDGARLLGLQQQFPAPHDQGANEPEPERIVGSTGIQDDIIGQKRDVRHDDELGIDCAAEGKPEGTEQRQEPSIAVGQSNQAIDCRQSLPPWPCPNGCHVIVCLAIGPVARRSVPITAIERHPARVRKDPGQRSCHRGLGCRSNAAS